MKSLKITFLMLCATLFFGCSNNDSTDTSTPALGGQWKLINVRGGFAGVNDTFPAGQIKWNVNLADNTVTVVNSNTNPNVQDILESGVYPLTLAPDPNTICPQTFNVNHMDFGCYTLSGNELEITYEYADGFTLRFVR